MKNIILSISIISFILILLTLYTLITNNSNVYFFNKMRNLSEGNKIEEPEKEKNQQQINYQIYVEMQKLEAEEEIRRQYKTKELIKKNIEKWENRKINKKEDKSVIACAYALDNSYVYPTLVSMTSLVENAANTTFYSIYVLISEDFSDESRTVIKSVEKNHNTSCEIIFINMEDKYKNEKTDKRIKTPAYYKLSLHDLLPNVKRAVWLDGDTGIFGDLTELINYDMGKNYMMGFLDSLPGAIDKFGIQNATVLCSGVLLIDLEALRKNNITEKFNKFMIEEKDNINQHDQTIINVVLQENIGPLPPKYGMWCFEAKIHALKHIRRQRPHLQCSEGEFIDAYYHPVIMHFVWPKPYWRRKKPVFNNEWWNYARKSGYYQDIYTKSPKFIRW